MLYKLDNVFDLLKRSAFLRTPCITAGGVGGAEHIKFLPGSLKRRKGVKNFRNFPAEHINFCQEA